MKKDKDDKHWIATNSIKMRSRGGLLRRNQTKHTIGWSTVAWLAIHAKAKTLQKQWQQNNNSGRHGNSFLQYVFSSQTYILWWVPSWHNLWGI